MRVRVCVSVHACAVLNCLEKHISRLISPGFCCCVIESRRRLVDRECMCIQTYTFNPAAAAAAVPSLSSRVMYLAWGGSLLKCSTPCF